MGVTEGHPAYDRVVAEALKEGLDPVGIPPSVVEQELLHPGQLI
jgi:hypothetical protein